MRGDRRRYAVDGVGGWRVSGIVARTATADAAGEVWHFRRSGRAAQATDGSGAVAAGVDGWVCRERHGLRARLAVRRRPGLTRSEQRGSRRVQVGCGSLQAPVTALLAPRVLAAMDTLGDRRRIDLFVPLRTLLLLAAVVAVLWAFVAVRDAFLAVFIGVFLALVFEFPVRWVMEKTHLSRGLAATVTVFGSLLAVLALGLVFLAPFVGAIRDFVKELPALVEELRGSGELGWTDDTGAAENVQAGANQLAAWIPETVGALLGVAGNAAGSLVMVFTVVFTALFLLTDVGDLKRAVASVLLPEQETRWLGVWERVTMSVSRWAIGVVVIAAIAGLTQGLTAWLLGSSFALALGLIAGFLDMIPNIGATLAGVILTLALLAEEGLQAALIMLAVVLVYQQLENNLVTPTVQGKAVNVSGFVIIVAVALFGALMGVLGAIVAVPLAATIQIVVQELTMARREQVAAAKAPAVTSS